MPAFRFKLEPVVKQRRAAEDAAQRDLAKAIRQRMILHDQLRLLQSTITQSKRDLAGGLTGRVDMAGVAGFARYSQQVAVRAHQIVARLAGVEKHVDAARSRLVEAMRARKAIERLRERHYRRWKQQQDRREAAQLDEAGVGMYAYSMVMEGR